MPEDKKENVEPKSDWRSQAREVGPLSELENLREERKRKALLGASKEGGAGTAQVEPKLDWRSQAREVDPRAELEYRREERKSLLGAGKGGSPRAAEVQRRILELEGGRGGHLKATGMGSLRAIPFSAQIAGLGGAVTSPESEKPFWEIYREKRDEFLKAAEAAEKDYPDDYLAGTWGPTILAVLGTAGGAAAGPAVPAIARGGPLLAKPGKEIVKEVGRRAGQRFLTAEGLKATLLGASKGVLVGGAMGGVYGAAESEGDLTRGEWVEVLKDAAPAAAFGAVLGGAVGAGRRFQTMQERIDKTVDSLSDKISAKELDKILDEAFNNRKSIFETASAAKYDEVNELFVNTNVSLRELKAEAAEMLKRIELGGAGSAGKRNVKSILDDILEKPDDIPFRDAQNLRSDLLEATRSKTEPLSSTATKRIKSLTNRADKAMEEAAEGVPGGEEVWRDANEFFKKGHEEFNTALVKAITRRKPEKLVDTLLRAGTPDATLELRKMIGEEVWRKVQGAYLRRLNALATDPVTEIVNAKKVLNKFRSLGDENVTAVFGKEKHKEIVEAYREIAKRQKPGGRGLLKTPTILFSGAGIQETLETILGK